MSLQVATIQDVRRAESIIRKHLSPTPLIRSYRMEKELDLAEGRRVWLKDYGSTPTGSFKVMGGLNWVANNLERIQDRPIAAHSSGNFASGISYAAMRYGKEVIIVMPDSAPQVKFDLTRSFGAEIRTYNIATDHETGIREQMTRSIAEEEKGIQASPYDDNNVIAGNGVGGLEIVEQLKREDRTISHFICPVSGGGLMAGQALAIADGFPDARLIAVEPDTADDFARSLAAGKRTSLKHPVSICDGLLSYDVGEHNWPVLQKHISNAVTVADLQTRLAMKWLYENHGLRAEPSGAISIAAALTGKAHLEGEGDIVLIISGRNVDETQFREWISDLPE